jgi:hypothetical protein
MSPKTGFAATLQRIRLPLPSSAKVTAWFTNALSRG